MVFASSVWKTQWDMFEFKTRLKAFYYIVTKSMFIKNIRSDIYPFSVRLNILFFIYLNIGYGSLCVIVWLFPCNSAMSSIVLNCIWSLLVLISSIRYNFKLGSSNLALVKFACVNMSCVISTEREWKRKNIM